MIAGHLFTREFLLEGVTSSEPWRALDKKGFGAFRDSVRDIASRFPHASKPNEAQTERDFIYPVLEALGWEAVQVQETLSVKGRKQVPDALLFVDAAAKKRAVAEQVPGNRYRHGLAIVEAKRWGRVLDRADKREPHEVGEPSAQMLEYLRRVDIQTNGRVRLGILTNGKIWRLYFQGALSVSEEYLEIDLAKALELPENDLDLLDRADPRLTPDHALRLFFLLFGKPAFLPIEGSRTLHDIAREEGKLWEEKVTRDLSQLVFGNLFPMLVGAIARCDKERPPEIDQHYLEQVRQSALILLYRLLFIVYAEDRDLLPDAQEPYKSYSLTAMRLDIAKRMSEKQHFSETVVTYWPKLVAIFGIIGDGKDELGVPPYNGGLFAKEHALLLDRVALPDSVIAKLIYGLSHRVENGEPRYINYRDLSVQQLGAVYERTLEFGLRVKDGAVVVEADDAARHGSGSYYTHDSLVMLIIEKAVGPLVRDILETFRKKAEELADDPRPAPRREALLVAFDPASALLQLKICDPAMGSGHFLVSLVDWLADRVLAAIKFAEDVADWMDEPYRSPVLDSIQATRSEIQHHAGQRGWHYEPEHLDNRHIVRRAILKRCIFGVDKNLMAVELAKVALWLHTFTVGAPLSFLDHHLRCGNSLFGAWVRPAMDKLDEWGSPLLMDGPRKRAFDAAPIMQMIEKLSDADIAEVVRSKQMFDGVSSMTAELVGLMDLVHAADQFVATKTDKVDRAAVQAWTKGAFGDPIALAYGRQTVSAPAEKTETNLERRKRELNGAKVTDREAALRLQDVLSNVRRYNAEERPLHWQVAFPGVWSEWENPELKGGFDAVIGNPPYVRQELIRPLKPVLERAFPDSYAGMADLYVYFYEQGLRLLKPGGRLAYTVTNKWLRAGYAEKLRGMFADRAWVEFVADFGHAKHFFPGTDVFPSVLVLRKPDDEAAPETTDVCVIPRDDVPEKGLDIAVEKATYRLPRAHFTKESWTLEPPEIAALLDKIRRNGVRLAEYAGVKPYRGVLTGFNEAFLINTPTRDRLIAEDPKVAEIIRAYLRGQDIERWHSPDSGLFMIFMKSSGDHPWPWANAASEEKAEAIFRKTFPSLHRHLQQYETLVDAKTGKRVGLRHRQDKGRWWWELRACAYYDVFESTKTMYVDIAWTPSMLVDRGARYTNNTCYMLPTPKLGPCVCMNAPAAWWYSWRKAQHGKDEALRFFTDYVNEFPIADLSSHENGVLMDAVAQLSDLKGRHILAKQVMFDWLRHTRGIEKPTQALANATTLDADAFVAAVRDALPKRKKLTAADIADLKREHAATIEPARRARGEIFALERKLSDLVNEAYGLTPEEVALMWRTAPPRMPFTPTGLAAPIAAESADDDTDHDAQA